MKVLAVLFLVAAILAGCVNLETPPPEFAMYCETCTRITGWGVREYYFYCQESGTIWNPMGN